jgi:hypothetical protein
MVIYKVFLIKTEKNNKYFSKYNKKAPKTKKSRLRWFKNLQSAFFRDKTRLMVLPKACLSDLFLNCRKNLPAKHSICVWASTSQIRT